MDIYFNAMKIKFADLNSITSNLIDNNNIHSANIFINLEDINSRFRTVKFNQEFQACGADAFKRYASNVFNLAAHYKQWASRLNISSKIYVYYTTAMGGFTSSVYNHSYRKDYIAKCDVRYSDSYYVNQTISQADNLLKTISKYIDGLYIIDSKGEEPSLIPYMISQHNPADWNFIITKDMFEFQYVNHPKFSIIYPSTTHGPEIINAGNLWEFVGRKTYTPNISANKFDPRLFLSVMGIMGDKRRSIEKLKRIGWTSIFDYLEKIWEKDKDHSFFTMQEALTDKVKSLGQDAVDRYCSNVLAMSMKSVYEITPEASKELIMLQIADVPDKESLELINRDPMILGNYPINLGFLLNGHTQKTTGMSKWGGLKKYNSSTYK